MGLGPSPNETLTLTLTPTPTVTLTLTLTLTLPLGNAYYDESYSLGVARSKTLRGEYVKAAQPILRTSSRRANPFVGPGHNSIIEDADGELRAIYHA